jgi:hypothetical protein
MVAKSVDPVRLTNRLNLNMVNRVLTLGRTKMIGLSAALSRRTIIGAAMVFAVGLNCLGTPHASAQNTPDYAVLMAAPDRSDADRVADKRRDPVPFLAFAGLKPGMKVLDMGAGAGYSTELVARVIGPTGTV